MKGHNDTVCSPGERAPESQLQQGEKQRHRIALTNLTCTVGTNAATQIPALLSLLGHATTKTLLTGSI